MRKIYLFVGGLLVVGGLAGFAVDDRVLLGLFAVDTTRNLVHLATGAVALRAAVAGIGPMRTAGRALGVLYLALSIFGLVQPAFLDLMDLNTPDTLLHLMVAAAFLYVGLLAPPRL